MEITNNDDLRDKIHEIHNYMRNNGIGYGLSSLKVFNFLYGLMKVEGYGLTDKIKFSELLKLANENSNKISETLDKYLTIICENENPQIKELLYYEIPDDIRDEVYNNLIIEIHNIKNVEKSSQELLSGKIYEYFVGRDQTAISELGAYFTNRRIVNFILEKVAPKIKDDGNIPKMIDMFGGSGGFTTGYMNYLNTYNKIDWKSQLDRIYHYDINADVLKSAALELLCLSDGVIPKIGRNIQKINSFKHNFHSENKFDLILTNPPYGGDKKATTGKKDKRDKIKNYIKNELLILEKDKEINKEVINFRKEQLKVIESQEKMEKKISESQTVNLNSCSLRIIKFGSENKLIANDKEACSLILMMELLETDGTAVGVIKEGVFFDGKYKDLRKCLIEKYNIKEIISVPQNQFENTSTKTSIIIFSNTEIKTTEIKFSELMVELYEDDKFIVDNNEVKLVYSKGDIKNVKETNISSVSINDILKNDTISLNSKDYNKVSIIPGEDFKLVKLGNISDINIGSTPNTKNYNYWENGDIDWISISDFNDDIIINTKKKLTKAGSETMINRKIPFNSILLSFKLTIGKVAFAGKDNMYCNEAITYLNSKIKNVSQLYLFNILKCIDIKQFGRGTIGSNGSLSKDILENLEIPIPKTPELLEYWENKISQPFMNKQQKEIKLKELKEEIKNKIKGIQENHECEEVKLGDICKIYGSPGGDKLGKFKRYDYINNKDINNYGFIRGCEISKKSKLKYYILKKDYDTYYKNSNNIVITNDLLITSCSQNISYYKIPIEWNNFPYHGCIRITNINIDINYLTSYMSSEIFINNILKQQNGSVVKYSNASHYNKIIIKIPKDKSLIDNLEPLFNEIEELQKEIKDLNETYNNQLNELSKAAILNQEILNTNEEELTEDIKDNIKEEIEEKEEIQEEIKSIKLQTIEELKEQCKTLGIKGYSKKKKDELIELIKNHK
jgi:type I restriction-modification system DNA methylase subunit